MEQKVEHQQALQGLRILIMDDEFLIMIAMEDLLGEAGANVMSASTLLAGLKMAQDEPLAAAVLDFRLGHETTEPVAEVLAKRSIPFVFYSGQTLPDRVLKRYSNSKVMTKPVGQDALLRAVIDLVQH